ncbi:hypothetical protein JJD41_20800 [Oxynema sp. CENA135]|uniref:hypothetical protein n=1 Tax=Oxynema sp. CENA135 TaxID=984206 RepID=UPI00190E5BD7|nr:hypothetical protein [Oxynema sp. CENA135]MBK4732286.1 hypothetical protein [Oxynema sp. CENA135]
MPVEPVEFYELDREVFRLLKKGIDDKRGDEHLDDWQGAASEIADYVASWGLERFWAMSRSQVLKNGKMPDPTDDADKLPWYFSWSVAREVLCKIVGTELGINYDMSTAEFQERLHGSEDSNYSNGLNFNQQVLLTDLLMEIAHTVQFWTMRFKDARESGKTV